MTLHYATANAEYDEIIDRLKSLSLAFTAEKAPNNSALKLVDSGVTIDGKDAILKHLDELAGELHQWYYCNC